MHNTIFEHLKEDTASVGKENANQGNEYLVLFEDELKLEKFSCKLQSVSILAMCSKTLGNCFFDPFAIANKNGPPCLGFPRLFLC